MKGDEDRFWNCTGEAIGSHTGQERGAQAADKGVYVGRTGFHAIAVEGEAIADDDPDDAQDCGERETLHEDGQDIFCCVRGRRKRARGRGWS